MKGLLDLHAQLLLVHLVAEVGEEVRNLVSIHAGSWHLDGTLPVEVVVAEVVGQLLEHLLVQLAVVEGAEEVSRHHASLGGELRNQIEVKLDVRVFSLHNVGVNDSSCIWVCEVTVSVLHKESLVDSLVHKNDCEVGFLVSLVVEVVDSRSELRDLSVEHLASHGIAHTVSVQNQVLG